MGKVLGAFAVAGAAVLALVIAYAVGAPPELVLGVGAAVLGLLWLLLLLTAPWNLYFRAHSVLAEIAVSREKGLTVSKERDGEARRIARTMLRVAVAGHVVTAAVVLAAGLAADRALGYWAAGFFLLSTAFRPAGAYFAQLRRRLGLLLRDVRFPRDDVAELRLRVDRFASATKLLEEKAEEQYRALAQLRGTVDALAHSSYRRADEADRRYAALAGEFEEKVNRLSDNEEIIVGLKAFLRLLRAQGAGPVEGPVG
ncbi:hypothetical protein H9Y04_09860 [Streptomyces sp. TRM66268-LWL]|uniref:Uncharacterized protein n=1 Tax=Streptomyces polyasparticus TaxID=2767826 RepID=A0ABR7SBM6_9ACTN|nr:hypothetical protein [Streptomyces polyasparticus]MBC9712876.1 hypothetical protein [Streptomyces polyasparticus]